MKSYIPALLWAILILLGSGWPGNALPPPIREFLIWDKIVHALAYLMLILLLEWGWRKKNDGAKRAPLTLPLAAIGYGILIEVLQFGLFPSRHFEIFDILANITGVLIGYVAFNFFTK